MLILLFMFMVLHATATAWLLGMSTEMRQPSCTMLPLIVL